MAAYGGYVAAEPLNLSGLITDFGTKAIAIQEANKEREEKKQLLQQQSAEKQALKEEERAYKEQQDALKSIEEQYKEDQKIISKPIPFTGSKTLDDLSAKVIPLVADSNYELNKLMKEDPSNSAELSAKKANMNKDFQTYVQIPETAIKGKQFITGVAKKQSKVGSMFGGKYISMLDVSRKNVTRTPDYRLLFFEKDEDGKDIPNSGIPVSAIANYGAYQDEYVDYDKEIADLNLGEYSQITSSGGRSQIETKSAKFNPQYEAVVNTYARSKTRTPEDITRILVEFGGYGAYIDGQNNISPQTQIDPATGNEYVKPVINFILTDNGGYAADNITQAMQNEAETILKQKVDASIGVDVSKTRNPEYVSEGGEKEPRDIPRMDVVEANKKVRQIESKDDSISIFKRVPGYKAKLESLAKKAGYKNVQIVYRNGGLAILGKVNKGDAVKTLQEFNNPESIYSWRNGLDTIVGSNEFSELVKEKKEEYLDIVNTGKEQMLNRAKKSTGGSKVGRYN